MNDRDIDNHIRISDPKEVLSIGFVELENFKGNIGKHVILNPKGRKIGIIYKAYSDGEYKFSSYNDYYIPWTESMLRTVLEVIRHLNSPSNGGTQKSLNLKET